MKEDVHSIFLQGRSVSVRSVLGMISRCTFESISMEAHAK